jgi:hypothetical protein
MKRLLYDEHDHVAKLNRCVGKCFLESGGFNYPSTITDAKYVQCRMSICLWVIQQRAIKNYRCIGNKVNNPKEVFRCLLSTSSREKGEGKNPQSMVISIHHSLRFNN